MQAAKVQFELAPPEFDTQGLVEVAISVLPPLLLLGGLFFLVRHPSPTQPTSPPNHTSPPITPLLPGRLSQPASQRRHPSPSSSPPRNPTPTPQPRPLIP